MRLSFHKSPFKKGFTILRFAVCALVAAVIT